MSVIVYNRRKECHDGPNNFRIFRGASVLGNPYTHIKDKETKACYVVKDREEAIKRYEEYFVMMYGRNKAFTDAFDQIYERYKTGEDIYLECYCHPLPCHGDIIANKLRQKLIKEKLHKNETI